MKTKLKFLFLLLPCVTCLHQVAAQGTAFTYQGRLNDGASPASGSYDFRFRLAADAQANTYVGSAFLTNGIAVTNGLFTTTIDFGSGVFNGANRWLEISVRTNGSASYTPLTPLQTIRPNPYAVFASNAGTAATLSGSLAATQISGLVPSASLSGTYSGILLLNNAGNSFSGSGANLTSLNANNLVSGTVPLARLNGITSNQLDQATWQYLVNLASGGTNSPQPLGMVVIPAGNFTMGNSIGDADISDAPTVAAYVSPFYMDTNLVSYSQWQVVYAYATNHGYGFVHAGSGKAVNHPVQNIDWDDCVKWCNARSQQEGRMPVYYTDAGLTKVYTNGEVTVYPNWTAKGYRLPTEAEWEKAARGGLSGQRFPWGNTISESRANFYGNTNSYSYDLGPNGYNSVGSVGGTSPATSPVGSFAPNGYGLYDMAGNVFEWCWDWYATTYGGGMDPRGPAFGSYRVLRGGSWFYQANSCRTAFHSLNYPPTDHSSYYGFRSVLLQ